MKGLIPFVRYLASFQHFSPVDLGPSLFVILPFLLPTFYQSLLSVSALVGSLRKGVTESLNYYLFIDVTAL